MHAFFSEGCHELDDGKRREKKKAEAKDEPMKCPSCRVIHRPAPFCPACGHEYPKKRAIEHVAGTLVEIMAGGNRKAISAALWDQVASYARRKRGEDGRGLALAIYREITGAWPIGEFANTKTVQVSPEARKLITHANIVFAKRREAAKRREVAAEVQA